MKAEVTLLSVDYRLRRPLEPQVDPRVDGERQIMAFMKVFLLVNNRWNVKHIKTQMVCQTVSERAENFSFSV